MTICSVNECKKQVLAKTFCSKHYQRFSRYGTTSLPSYNPSLRTSLYGIGINDADYVTSDCPYYNSFSNMFMRCYSGAYHKKNPTYIDCTVAPEWHAFSNFRRWMKNQDWKGKQLDKDIITPGNKEYSPGQCCFVSSAANGVLISHPLGKSLKGVNKLNGEIFYVQMSKYGKRIKIGTYKSQEEAETGYRNAKAKHIREVAMTQEDPRVKQGLLRHADIYDGTGSGR